MEETHSFELLDRFMQGTLTADETQQLLALLQSPASGRALFGYYRRRWIEAEGKQLDREVQIRMLLRIKERIHASSQHKQDTKSTKRMLRAWQGCAAAILLCLVLNLSYTLFRPHPDATPTDTTPASRCEVSVEKGQQAHVTLPDGTRVWLNSHTTLAYLSDYGMHQRRLSLSGEAYFEVAPDSTRRFIVEAGKMEVEALGTAFNVRAYPEDREVSATLFKGKVRATTGDETVTLHPDECLTYDKTSGKITRYTDASRYALLWRENELAFHGETLEEIALRLNRLYNVQVHFATEKLKKYRFSGIIKNNSLENVIELISLTAPITYRKTGSNEILLEERKSGEQ